MSVVIHSPLIGSMVVKDLTWSQSHVDSWVPLLLILLLLMLLMMMMMMTMMMVEQRIASVGVLPLLNATLLFSSVHGRHLDTTN